MSIYHCSVKIHSYSKGQDPLATIAYRSGEKLEGLDGKVIDYSKRKDIAYTEILLPEHVEKMRSEFKNRQTLWTAVAKAEERNGGRFIREFEVALPKELDLESMKEIVRNFSSGLTADGMIVDYAIHQPKKIEELDDETNGNWHAHICCTTRKISEDGCWEKKSTSTYVLDKNGEKIPEIDPKTGMQRVRVREGHGTEKLWKREKVASNDWNKKEKVNEWRKLWERCVNAGLQKDGIKDRVDCRSLEDQGIERTPQIHVGVAAKAIAKKQEQGNEIGYEQYSTGNKERIVEGFKHLLHMIKAIRQTTDVVFHRKMDCIYEHCMKVLDRIDVVGMTRKEVNELIKAKNEVADLVEKQIHELEKELADIRGKKQKDQDDVEKERELHERLERLRTARDADEHARRNAEGDRATENRKEESRDAEKRHYHRR